MDQVERIPVVPSLDQIRRLQAEMAKLPQLELPTQHYFANEMYCRALFLPMGTLVVGKLHKQEHFFILSYGELTVWMETGMKRIGSGTVVESKPGTKRVILAHEDSLALTVHRTELTNLDEIEAEIIEYEEAALFDARNLLKALT